jgi:hypothetical protein
MVRELMRKIADNEVYSVPSTIDDVTVIAEIEEILQKNKRTK